MEQGDEPRPLRRPEEVNWRIPLARANLNEDRAGQIRSVRKPHFPGTESPLCVAPVYSDN